jgi:hypothetical protein
MRELKAMREESFSLAFDLLFEQFTECTEL